MPRRKVGKRGDTWEIKTRPDLLHPVLSSKHKEMVKSIKHDYFLIDTLYERVAKILDSEGVITQARLIYRSFAEELFKLSQKYTSKTLNIQANAIAQTYGAYGCDWSILKKIANLFGIKVAPIVPPPPPVVPPLISYTTEIREPVLREITTKPTSIFAIELSPPVLRTKDLPVDLTYTKQALAPVSQSVTIQPALTFSTALEALKKIWHCDRYADKVYELSTADFSVIRSAASPTSDPFGIGGDTNTIWHCEGNFAEVYELSTADFSVIRSASAPSIAPRGIGGDADTIWHCDDDADKVYELSTADFSVIRSASAPPYFQDGIGGDADTIWYCEGNFDEVYELSTADFSVIRRASSPSSSPSGIGG